VTGGRNLDVEHPATTGAGRLRDENGLSFNFYGGNMKNRNCTHTAVASKAPVTFASTRLIVALAIPAILLSGCYVMPAGQDASGNPYYVYSPLPIPPSAVQQRSTTNGARPAAAPGGGAPQSLSVKLYPINDLANQTGILTGEVTNMMTGQGRFTFHYQGETLVGEATRVSNDDRRGLASAYGPCGTSARCEYQMSTARMGAGTCTFSNGAQYQLHVGS